MPMAGYDGEIKVAKQVIGYIDSASLNITTGTAETSSLGSEFKEFMETVTEWSGSASGTLDYADAGQKELADRVASESKEKKGQLAELSIKVSPIKTYRGDAIITNMQIGIEHGGKVSCNFSFQGSGTPNKQEVIL